jgi:hypothetical protein
MTRQPERVHITAATPEQVDLVLALRRLTEVIPPLLPKVITGELLASGWSNLADILYQAARLCRQQVIIDAED